MEVFIFFDYDKTGYTGIYYMCLTCYIIGFKLHCNIRILYTINYKKLKKKLPHQAIQ